MPKYEDIAMAWSESARGVLIEGTAPGVHNSLVHEVWHDADKEYLMLSERIMDPRPEVFPQAPPGGKSTSNHSWTNQAPECLGYLLTDC